MNRKDEIQASQMLDRMHGTDITGPRYGEEHSVPMSHADKVWMAQMMDKMKGTDVAGELHGREYSIAHDPKAYDLGPMPRSRREKAASVVKFLKAQSDDPESVMASSIRKTKARETRENLHRLTRGDRVGGVPESATNRNQTRSGEHDLYLGLPSSPINNQVTGSGHGPPIGG